ncbi:multidrug efflux SMR transporter [Tessaracoccus sp. OH4464_COT-324]|uniref:DMT family transporter n=1 Tax=Tessaracoccus sp. OH4464_COT-324 TaxID=2491059 RepID=UPI0018F6FF35|nr:multidrug efflux SMR transporter [Tessaracoccus sp. OH4464_COT-324]
MDWLVLVLSGALEAVWATALSMSDGFRRRIPALVFALAAPASLAGLGYALLTIPTGTAYAAWTSIGAALTVGVAMWRGEEPASLARLGLIVAVVGCVVGLKVAT